MTSTASLGQLNVCVWFFFGIELLYHISGAVSESRHLLVGGETYSYCIETQQAKCSGTSIFNICGTIPTQRISAETAARMASRMPHQNAWSQPAWHRSVLAMIKSVYGGEYQAPHSISQSICYRWCFNVHSITDTIHFQGCVNQTHQEFSRQPIQHCCCQATKE